MSEPAISVTGLGKAYRMWATPAARLTSPMLEAVARVSGWDSLRARAQGRYRDFWALRDVSLEVARGECVGIIGRNGSGKSTLLQILAGTLQPTTGQFRVQGRVAALLELGSGFNAEFTGRENVFLNGAVLGLTNEEVASRFDRIAAFADIGTFIDQPVKTYSSGMMVRLAFAVQIQLDPDILIVDEALSVGDEPFQRKCFSQLALMQERGVTILFVSHSAATVIELCDRVMLLDQGRLLLTAGPKTAVQHYYQLCYSPAERLSEVREQIAAVAAAGPMAAGSRPQTIQGEAVPEKGQPYFLESLQSDSRAEFPSRGAKIESVQIVDHEHRPANVLVKGQTYAVQCRIRFTAGCQRVRFGWTAKTVTGLVISGAGTHPEGEGVPDFGMGDFLQLDFKFCCLFNPGTYFVDVAVRAQLDEPDAIIHGINDALIFKVQPVPRIHRNGHIDTSAEPVWTISHLEGRHS